MIEILKRASDKTGETFRSIHLGSRRASHTYPPRPPSFGVIAVSRNIPLFKSRNSLTWPRKPQRPAALRWENTSRPPVRLCIPYSGVPIVIDPCVDKKTRDKAIKSLASFLSDPAREALPKSEMAKLWKGVFYCASSIPSMSNWPISADTP